MAAAATEGRVALRQVACAVEAVLRATRVTSQLQPGIHAAQSSSAKLDSSPVTVADFASEVVVVNVLQTFLGQDCPPMISEEDADGLAGEDQAAVLDAVVEAANMGLEGLSFVTREAVLESLRWGHRSSTDGKGAWVLDPIDGTKGFLRGPKHQYAVGLGFVDASGQPALGVLACPNLPRTRVKEEDLAAFGGPRGVLLVGVPGEGAWEFPLPDALTRSAAEASSAVDWDTRAVGEMLPHGRRIHTQARAGPSSWRTCESYEAAHSSHALSAAVVAALGCHGKPVRVDSMVKYALLARGDAHLYLRFPRAGYEEKVWDHVAGSAILHAAGGSVTDERGGPLPFGSGPLLTGVTGIIASAVSSEPHKDIIRVVEGCKPMSD